MLSSEWQRRKSLLCTGLVRGVEIELCRAWSDRLLYALDLCLAVPGLTYMCSTCLFSLRYLFASAWDILRFIFLCISYRIIHGVGKPDEVLECIERGVDIFESFFPFQVTERGCALVFGYDYHSDPKAAGRMCPYQLVVWQA